MRKLHPGPASSGGDSGGGRISATTTPSRQPPVLPATGATALEVMGLLGRRQGGFFLSSTMVTAMKRSSGRPSMQAAATQAAGSRTPATGSGPLGCGPHRQGSGSLDVSDAEAATWQCSVPSGRSCSSLPAPSSCCHVPCLQCARHGHNAGASYIHRRGYVGVIQPWLFPPLVLAISPRIQWTYYSSQDSPLRHAFPVHAVWS